MKISRRQTLAGATWSAPIILASSAIPAYAVSNEARFGFNFDGGGGANGYQNSVYLNFGTTDGSTYTLQKPVVVTVNVVGLNTNTTTQRSFTSGSSNGTIGTKTYTAATRTTSFTWIIPAGTQIPPLATGGTALPDILFSFGDGLAGGQRITNKIVVMSAQNARVSQSLPLDSSIAKDINKGAVSPDGIY
ncbi:hypothetical protein [uncultured Rothia sp.]|uniref:hypothetical protein n=1 Tax=uncultured Rothia sp. TaxID=316088 RepID=UPI003217B571